MKKIILSTTIILIVIIMIVILYFLFIPFIPDNKIKISYDYKIEINTSNNLEFELYLPAVISDKNPSLSLNESDTPNFIKGNGLIEIVNTKYGYAFYIKSNESLIIECSKKYELEHGEKYNHYLLSLENREDIDWTGDTEYWYFANINNSNSSIKIKADFDHKVKSERSEGEWHTEINFNEKINNGWNLINATKRTITSD